MIDPEKYKGKRGVDDDDRRDDDDIDDDIVDDGRETDALGLDELLTSYGEPGGYVLLRRQELGEWTFLARVQIADAKLDQIQARFGGGKYRAEIVGENGRRWKQRTFRIAGRSKNDDDQPSANSEIEQRFARLESLLTERETKPANGETVGIADVLKVALTALTARPTVDPLMQTLITALVGNKKNGDSVDPLELQKLLQAAEDRGYNRGKELGEAIASAGGDGDGVARALASNLPGVIDAFKSAKQSYDATRVQRPVPQATAQMRAPEAAPGIVNEPGPEPKPLPTTEGEAMGLGWINALRPAVPVILKWARDGKDAQIKAANTVDDLSDSIRDAIAVQAEEPEFVSSVITAIPEFQAPEVREWVTAFLSTVQEILTAPDEETGAELVEA